MKLLSVCDSSCGIWGVESGVSRVLNLGEEMAAVQIMLCVPYLNYFHRCLPEPFGSSLIRLLNMYCNILLGVFFSHCLYVLTYSQALKRPCFCHYTSGQFSTESHIITTLSLSSPTVQQLLSRIFIGLKTGLAPSGTQTFELLT